MVVIKRVIINADDFGLHREINNGIIEGHRSGCVTSATIMAGGEAFDHAVFLARRYPKLSVGVHLTLVGAKPVARGDIHTLLNRDGTLLSSYGEFARRYLRGAISQNHIEYELRCQLQKVAGSGIAISHLDSHQHLHAFPGMADIIVRLAEEFKVTKIRIPAEPFTFFNPGKLDLSRILARTVLTGCALWARRGLKAKGMSSPGHFFGMLSGGAMNAERLAALIRRLPDGVSEIMVHPGSNNSVLSRSFGWGYRWQEELEALKSGEVLQAIRDNDVHLINYWELDNENH